MTKMMLGLGLVVLAGVLLAESLSPAAAQNTRRSMHQLAAQRRPQITIRPRHRRLSPNATRHCTAWLAKEYRPSGTVITPQMRCWWED
jgi:hypothetical protein